MVATDKGTLEGSTALVTGATRGIGRAVVEFFERYPPGGGGGEGRR